MQHSGTTLVSYVFAALAGIFFVRGVAVLSSGGGEYIRESGNHS